MRKVFDLLVFIGRFQPFHNGHKKVVDQALKDAENVLLLVGSAGSPRTTRNPFSYPERVKMISSVYDDGDHSPALLFAPVYDRLYNDTAWIKQVQECVQGTLDRLGIIKGRVGLIGASKDHTSYYLNIFPQWSTVNVPLDDSIMHATDVRDFYFKTGTVKSNYAPYNVRTFLEDVFYHSEDFKLLAEELAYNESYKKAWEAAPYPVKHVTVDAVVEQSGHILLVRRKHNPGKGLWALPGGHLELHERLKEGVIREVREETGLKVPDKVLTGSLKADHIFDEVNRSNIGRVITYAQHIKLQDNMELPKVKGMDDADKAKWVPLVDIKENLVFDDHFHIINYFVGLD